MTIARLTRYFPRLPGRSATPVYDDALNQYVGRDGSAIRTPFPVSADINPYPGWIYDRTVGATANRGTSIPASNDNRLEGTQTWISSRHQRPRRSKTGHSTKSRSTTAPA